MVNFTKKDSTTFNMRVGTKIIRQLSTAFYPDLTFVFDELVSNARDAMATRVKIHVGEDSITIEDNGEGMNEDQLKKFFYISHTEKDEIEEKVKGNIKRKVIGKFGIGKLSMYRICNKFQIVAWQGDNVYKSDFDFEELERKEFIDQVDLNVQASKGFVSESETGTKITLSNLKPTGITARDVKRSLQLRMPLSPDFIVFISGLGISGEVQLNSDDIISGGDIYNVEGNIPKVGLVHAKIAFLQPGMRKVESGIYIRVLGRIVNYLTAKSVMDFRNMTHGDQFYRSIMVEVEADGLDKVLLTNRAGFSEDSEEYKDFLVWIKSQVEKHAEIEYGKWQEGGQKIEKNVIPELTRDFIKTSISESQVSQKILGPTMKFNVMKNSFRKSVTGKPSGWGSVFSVSGIKFEVLTEEMGVDEPEARFDKRTKTIFINTLHPMYMFARKYGKLTGALYHSLKAAIVFLAINNAKNLKDFESLYNEMTIGAGSALKKVNLMRTKNSLTPVAKKVK